jgi:hypothetical protein
VKLDQHPPSTSIARKHVGHQLLIAAHGPLPERPAGC